MAQRNGPSTGSGQGLPPREPERRLGVNPQLPAQPGGAAPYSPTPPSSTQVHPGPEAPGTFRAPSIRGGTPRGIPGAPPAPTWPGSGGQVGAGGQVGFPRNFDELLFLLVLMTPAREVPIIIEQEIAAGTSGTVSVAIPSNRVDVARALRESGDGSVSYRIEIDGAGRLAVPQHRITGAPREFGRFWEKYSEVIISFTNTDPVNPALLQLEWLSVQVDVAKWGQFRDNIRTWNQLLGVQE